MRDVFITGSDRDGTSLDGDAGGAGWLEPLRAGMATFLSGYAGKPVLYLPNPGNAGDSMIAVATEQAFARAGVPLEVADDNAAVDGRVVFLAGGGNLVPFYQDIARAFARVLGRASEIVLLPHTVRGHEETLAALDGTCTLFCRDRESLDHVRATAPRARARLAHDMAFHLDARSLLADPILTARGMPAVEATLTRAGIDAAELKALEVADFSRLDREAADPRPVSLLDVSEAFAFGVGPSEAALATFCLLTALRLARRISTDRLHVGIGAALMGVPCQLRDNSYGKNAAVFAHSLAGRQASVALAAAGCETCRAARRGLEAHRAVRRELEVCLARLQANFQRADAALAEAREGRGSPWSGHKEGDELRRSRLDAELAARRAGLAAVAAQAARVAELEAEVERLRAANERAAARERELREDRAALEGMLARARREKRCEGG